MTDRDLLRLKALAARAKPYTREDADAEESESESLARIKANGEFFLAAHRIVPEMVDQLLEIRAVRRYIILGAVDDYWVM